MPRPGRAGRRRGDGARPGGCPRRRGRQQTGPPMTGRRTGRARRFKARREYCTAAETHRNGGHSEPAGRLEDGGKGGEGGGKGAHIGLRRMMSASISEMPTRQARAPAGRPCPAAAGCASVSRGGGGAEGARAEAGAPGLCPAFLTAPRPVGELEIETTRATRRPSQSPSAGARARPPSASWRELWTARGGNGGGNAVVIIPAKTEKNPAGLERQRGRECHLDYPQLLEWFLAAQCSAGCRIARARRGMRRQRRPGVTVRR